MRIRPISKRSAATMAAGAAVLIYAFDMTQPLGVAGGTPYVALPLLGLLARTPRVVVLFAVAGSVLTVAGAIHSAAGAPIQIVLLNRGMSLTLIWVVAVISLRHLEVGKQLLESLKQQASRDPLTNLYNRRYLFGLVETELTRFRRYGEPFSLILIDADYFKRVNDTYGHCAGDAVLCQIAAACEASVRETDVVGRFGGEEFVVLLPHTEAREALVVAERIRAAMKTTELVYRDQVIDVTLSLGVAEVCASSGMFDDILKRADDALYAAKHAGRDRVVVISNPVTRPKAQNRTKECA